MVALTSARYAKLRLPDYLSMAVVAKQIPLEWKAYAAYCNLCSFREACLAKH